VTYGVDTAGRWSLLRSERPKDASAPADSTMARDVDVDRLAWSLLRRYGVVFRRLLDREELSVPWRELLMAYRRLEARGEIRGGRFVNGFSGEQFALPEAVALLRKTRSSAPSGELVIISAADPLNLTGIVTPGDRVPALAANRVGYRDGVPAYALEGREVRPLDPRSEPLQQDVRQAMVRVRPMPALRGYVGRRV
jgi:ATP-dependent Lhr-like helicase